MISIPTTPEDPVNQTLSEAPAQPVCNSAATTRYVDSEIIGAEITELCSYIYAATYRLLVLIYEFDQNCGLTFSGMYAFARHRH